MNRGISGLGLAATLISMILRPKSHEGTDLASVSPQGATLENVVLKIRDRPTTLFYGAGVCKGCGGPSGDELLRSVGLGIGNPMSFLQRMNDVLKFDDSNRGEVEERVKQQLSPVSPHDEQRYLFSMPWRALC